MVEVGWDRPQNCAQESSASCDVALRAGKRGSDAALLDRELAGQVGRELFVDHGRLRRRRCRGIDDGRQRLDVDDNQHGGIERLVAALGHDDRNRFADMADLVGPAAMDLHAVMTDLDRSPLAR